MLLVWCAFGVDLRCMQKNTGRTSFAEVAISHRKTSNLFLERVNALIDWDQVGAVLDNYDRRGKGIAGNSAYLGLVLFRMCELLPLDRTTIGPFLVCVTA